MASGATSCAPIADDLVAALGATDKPTTLAVGSVHELAGLPSRSASARAHARLAPRVPHDCAVAHNRPIVTVGDGAHLAALDGWRGDVLVKLASSMRRFGVAPRELDDFERTRASCRADGDRLQHPPATRRRRRRPCRRGRALAGRARPPAPAVGQPSPRCG